MNHQHWMGLALKEAKRAQTLGEVPIGAVIIHEQTIIATSHNKTITDMDPTAHAEILSIQEACQHLQNHRIPTTVLYVTLEPCIMCLGAIIQARIPTIIYGASDTRTGVFSNNISSQTLSLNHHPEHIGGILSDECSELLRSFFNARR